MSVSIIKLRGVHVTNMKAKYVFTGKTKESITGRLLHQIKAIRNLSSTHVKAGDVGGWIEKESNLSHNGDCWVFPDAEVFDGASLSGNARIYDRVIVCGQARVYDNAKIYGKARVYNQAIVRGNAQINGPVHIYGDTLVDGDAIFTQSIHGAPMIL